MYPRPFYVWVVGILVITYGLFGVAACFAETNDDAVAMVGAMAAFFGCVVLGSFIIKGSNWARVTFSSVSILFSIAAAIVLFDNPNFELGLNIATTAFSALLLMSVILITLLFLPAANLYFSDPESTRFLPELFSQRREAQFEIEPERSHSREEKPVYVVFVGALLCVCGEGLVLRFVPASLAGDPAQTFDPNDPTSYIFAAYYLGLLLSGAFIIHGANGGRWLYVAICILAISISVYDRMNFIGQPLWQMALLPLLLFFLLLLFLPPAHRYFTDRDPD
jgi:hypothetical protein